MWSRNVFRGPVPEGMRMLGEVGADVLAPAV